jgi:hypothetical protein
MQAHLAKSDAATERADTMIPGGVPPGITPSPGSGA